MIKLFLNTFSRLIAWVLEGIDPKALSEADRQKCSEWIETCRQEDALDGVVEIRKAADDYPDDP